MPKARKEKEYYSYVDEWKTLWKPDLDALGGYNGQSCDPTRVDPKVIQWVKDNCAQMPHFVKVIKPNAARGRPGLVSKNSNCLAVPIPFAQQHFRELDRVITLENDEGRTWRVSFGSPRKQPTWSQGWDRVARDNNLKPGDVVVFVLVRKSCFRFTLFDADGNIRKKRITKSSDVIAIADPALICKEEFPGSSSWSLQEKPFVSNLDSIDHNPKTRKRLLTVSKDIDLNIANQEAGIEERDGTAPGNYHRHAEPNLLPGLPAKKQITEPPYEEHRKMQKTDEEFAAPCQTPNLRIEEKILKFKVESDPSSAIGNATSTKDAPHCEVDPYNPLQSSPVPELRDTSPRFETFDPFAFTFKSKRRMITALERQGAGNLAMAHANVLTEQYFVCAMSETHDYRDFHLVIPGYFAAATSLPASPTRLKFLDCAGHSWDVYSKKNACNQFAVHRKYWALFALHHLLEEGDVCVFALKENEPARSVLVHIFRVVPVSSRDTTSVHSHYEMHESDGTQTCAPAN